MRATYLPRIPDSDHVIVSGDAAHHLASVVRVEPGEALLLLDGKGTMVKASVATVTKKEVKLLTGDRVQSERSYSFSLALGVPKREALELSLKEATELGVDNVYLIRAEYSQMKIPEPERLESLLIAALEQSNAAFLPKVISCEWDSVPWEAFDEVVLLDSQRKGSKKKSAGPKKLLVVGPEGGFSPEELERLHALPMVSVVNLPTPILRTPTAVATGMGMLLEGLRK